MQRKRLMVQIEGAIIAAIAMALEYIPTSIGPSSIQVSLGIIPIALYSFRRGANPGMVAALIWGLLDLVLRGFSSGSVLNVWQGLLEYTFAFLVVGFAGVVRVPLREALQRQRKRTAIGWILFGVFCGTFAKYLLHFFAGVFYWGSYAPKGMNAWLYSFIINGGSFAASFVVASLVLVLFLSVQSKLFLPRP